MDILLVLALGRDKHTKSLVSTEEAPQESVKEAGKKKGKEEKEEDIDALLAEFGVDTKAAGSL